MKFVAIQSYHNYIDAHLAAGRLEQEHIRVWLEDENTATLIPVDSIKLMVAEAQAERAIRLLQVIESAQKQAKTCPQCQSTDIAPAMHKASSLSNSIRSFFGKHSLAPQSSFHCLSCAAEF